MIQMKLLFDIKVSFQFSKIKFKLIKVNKIENGIIRNLFIYLS
jgi:hypothetical protein